MKIIRKLSKLFDSVTVFCIVYPTCVHNMTPTVYFVFTAFFLSGFVFSVLAKRLVGKSVSETTHYVSSGTLNVNAISQLSLASLRGR